MSTEPQPQEQVAELLRRVEQSEPRAADQLFALLYGELHRLAERHLRRGGAGLTLSTTMLVHETYLSLAGRDEVAFPDRARFFAYASRAMRGLIVDYARRRRARKHDRGFEITLTDGAFGSDGVLDDDLQALDEALGGLAELDPALAELVDLHFFGGFSFVEIAGLRGVSDRTVQRDWRKARLLLYRWLHDPGPDAPA